MEYVFTCTCKTLFGRYIRDGQVPVAKCPSCGENVQSDLSMRSTREGTRSPMIIIGDISPFKSPVDGSVVGSRTTLAEHNRRNDVVQVGTDKWPTRTDAAPMSRPGYDVKRALETARS